jgi:serine/threonine protein kinase
MLNRLDEEEIRQYVRRIFSYLPRKPSSDAINFVRSCLKPDPLHRISAQEAKKHKWLRDNKKNAELLKRLEKVVLSSWKPQGALRPMPWSLPDLAPISRHQKLDCYSLRDGMTRSAQPLLFYGNLLLIPLPNSPSTSTVSMGSPTSRYFISTP